MSEKVEALLREATERGDVPGVSACVTDRNGVAWEGGFGRRVIDGPFDMAADTVVAIASMTKAITGAAAMQCVERGALSLDAPARDVLPHLGEVGVLEGFDADGAPRMRKPRRDITLRHLLTHTAGFGYDIFNADIQRVRDALGLPDTNSGRIAALDTPLLFDPGDRWEYGISIDWAGKMVEAVSGTTLGACFREHLLGPLGMDDTTFVLTPALRARRATMHARLPEGTLAADPDFEMPQDAEWDAGGHGLYGTVLDYLRFVRMMLNEGRNDAGDAVLAPETVAAMSRNAMGATRVPPIRSANPLLSNDADFLPGIEKSHGLSFMINEADAPTGRSAGSLAWAGLANSFYWIDPKRGLGGVFATQILPFADPVAMPLFEAFESAVYEDLAG